MASIDRCSEPGFAFGGGATAVATFALSGELFERACVIARPYMYV